MVVNIVNDGLPSSNQVFEPNLSQTEGAMERGADLLAMSQNPSIGTVLIFQLSPGFGSCGFTVLAQVSQFWILLLDSRVSVQCF